MQGAHKKLLLFAGIFVVVFLVLFLLIEALGVPLLHDPVRWLQDNTMAAAGVSVSLLAADVFLPVPSSFLMTVNGRLFGILGGTLVSLSGYLLAALIGYGLGRYCERILKRMTSADELKQADAFMARWGMFSVVLSRPIPILAETVAVCAGAARLDLRRYLLSAAAGSIPICIIYALTGALAVDLKAGLISLLAVLALSGLFWRFGRRM